MKNIKSLKPLFLLTVTVLMALCLSTALVACDEKNENNSNTGGNTSIAVDKIEQFEISKDGTTILGLKDEFKNATSVSIPYDQGFTQIAENAFANCTALSRIHLNPLLESIGANAFYNTAWYNAQPDGPVYLGEWLVGYKGNNTNIVEIQQNTRGLADGVFYGNFKLQTITIPSCVQYIGKNTFGKCHNITTAILPEYAVAFIPKDNLQVVSINYGNKIENNTFKDYDKLKSVTLPEDLYEIGQGAFSHCTALEEIAIPDNVRYIEQGAFEACTKLKDIKLPENLEKVSAWTFNNCTSLEEIVIPNYAGNIETRAFANCTKLKSITLPKNLWNIGDDAFWQCQSLASIDIPDSIEKIGNYAFSGCSALENLKVGSGLKYVGLYPFSNCLNLKHITIPAILATTNMIPRSNLQSVTVNGGDTIGRYSFADCSKLTSVTLCDGIKTIEEGAFYNTFRLERIEFKEGLLDIGNEAFLNSAIESIALPQSLRSIGEQAFKSCKLEEFTAPNNVAYIGDKAFNSCRNLKKLTIASKDVLLGEDIVRECENLVDVSIPLSALKMMPAHQIKKLAITSGDALYYEAINGFDVLEEITLCDQIKTVDERAFKNCYSIRTATLPAVALEALPKYSLETVKVTSGNAISKYAFSWAENLTNVTLSEEIQYISDGAFSNCTSLKSIVIPQNVSTIYGDSFFYCTALESITVEKGNYKYYSSGNCVIEKESGCVILGCKTSVIPSDGSIKAIGAYAFYACNGLKQIEIPAGVEKIGYQSFAGCSSLTEIVIPETVSYIYEGAFSACGIREIVIPERVYHLDINAFSYCKELTRAEIKARSSFYRIPEGTFKECTKLASVTMSDTIMSIDKYAFYNCGSLKDVKFSEDLEDISDMAFGNCYSLYSLILPEKLRYISSDAFYNCYKLFEIYNKSSLNIVAGSSNNGRIGYYAKDIYTSDYASKFSTTEDGYLIYCDGSDKILMGYYGTATELTLPNDITKINDAAFANCAVIESITVPDQITEIGAQTFSNCVNLKTIHLSGNITKIGWHAFEGCKSLTDIYYDGTKENYKKAGDGYWINTSFYVIHCSDGNMDRLGNDLTEQTQD